MGNIIYVKKCEYKECQENFSDMLEVPALWWGCCDFSAFIFCKRHMHEQQHIYSSFNIYDVMCEHKLGYNQNGLRYNYQDFESLNYSDLKELYLAQRASVDVRMKFMNNLKGWKDLTPNDKDRDLVEDYKIRDENFQCLKEYLSSVGFQNKLTKRFKDCSCQEDLIDFFREFKDSDINYN